MTTYLPITTPAELDAARKAGYPIQYNSWLNMCHSLGGTADEIDTYDSNSYDSGWVVQFSCNDGCTYGWDSKTERFMGAIRAVIS